MAERNKQLDDKLKAFFSIDNCIEDSMGNNIIDVCEFSLDFSLEETRSILNEYGTQIKKLRYLSTIDNGEIEQYAYLFVRHCKYLEYIHMIGFEVLAENVPGQLLASSKFVTHLKLNYCRVSNFVFDLISGLTDLERLDFEGSALAGKLTTLNKLIDLNLQNCSLIGNPNSLDVCRQQNLKKLNLNNFWNENAEYLFDSDSDSLEFYSIENSKSSNLSRLLEVQEHLETLILSANQVKYCGIRIRNLREICIVRIDNLYYDSPLRQLIEKHKEILEAIEINYNVFVSEDDGYEIKNGLKNLKTLSYTLVSERDILSYFGESCPKLEMLDIRGSKLKDTCILEGIKDMAKLRYLDLSYCDVQKSFYGRLVEARKSQGFQDQMIVFINPKMTLMDVMDSDFYYDNEDYVRLTTQKMRHHNDISLLSGLARLNAQYPVKTNHMNSSKRESTNSSLIAHKLRILDLNQECLLQITKYLYMHEIFTLGLTSKQFDHIIEDSLKKDIIDIDDLSAHFTLREAHSIFARFGHMMRHISIEDRFRTQEYNNLALQHCNKLESFVVSTPDLFSECADQLIALSGTTLKSLKIFADSNIFIFTGDGTPYQLPCLEKLSIGCHLLGKYTSKLTSLKSLYLHKCNELQFCAFESICKSNQLTELHMLSCYDTNDKIFSTMVETQKSLRILSLHLVDSCAPHLNVLSELENLIDISFVDCDPEATVSFLKALKYCSKEQIKYLEVEVKSWETLSVTTLSDYLDSIAEFPNLMYLRSQLPNNIVDYAFVKRIIKSCPRLEIFAIEHVNTTSADVFIEAVQMFPNLRHISLIQIKIPEIYWNLHERFYEIKQTRKDRMQLVVHSLNVPEHVKDTRQYKSMERYVCVSDETISEMTRAQLMKKTWLHETHQKNISSEGPILSLPNDCLRKIASNLESIDKLTFAFTNKKILGAIKPMANTILFDINQISRRFTLDEAERLFNEFRDEIYCFEYIGSHLSDPMDYLKLIVPFSRNFREVNLQAPCLYQKFSVENLFSFPDQKLEKLKLALTDIKSIMAKILNKYTEGLCPNDKLMELCLRSLVNIPQLKDFIKNSRLKLLDIGECAVSDEDFIAILENQKHYLETLRIGLHWADSKNALTIASLPNLKHLRIAITSHHLFLDELFFYLIKYRRNDLISIEILFCGRNWIDFAITSNFFEGKKRKFENLKQGCLINSRNV